MFPERKKGIVVLHLRDEDDAVIPLKFFPDGAEGFPEQPFDAVSLHALAVALTHGNAHAHLLCGSIDHRERRRKRPFAAGKQLVEVRLFFQPQIVHGAPSPARFSPRLSNSGR